MDRGLNLRGLKIVLDCAHGATYAVAPKVFAELGADVTVIGASPDGTNINAGHGSTQPQAMADKVVETGADVGIAFDGDGDRVVMADAGGKVYDGDDLLYIIAKSAFLHGLHGPHGRMRGGVVGTVMTNLGLERALETWRHPVRARPGRRPLRAGAHAGQRLAAWRGIFRHLICLHLTTTGDGIVAALQVLAAMVETGRSSRSCRAGMQKFPQTMVNVQTGRAGTVATSPALAKAVQAIETQLGERGRVVIRPSGTEAGAAHHGRGRACAIVREHAESLAATRSRSGCCSPKQRDLTLARQRRRPLVAANWKMHGDRDFVAKFAAEWPGAPAAVGRGAVSTHRLFWTPSPRRSVPPRCSSGYRTRRPKPLAHTPANTPRRWPRTSAPDSPSVGHSERRRLFGETDAVVAGKCEAARRAGLTPILCVGETLNERQAGSAERIVAAQLDAASAGSPYALVIAYEPGLAIGTGRDGDAGACAGDAC